MPGLWLYIHGPTHHWAISAEREAGRLLPAAEAFSTVRALLDGSFAGYPAGRLEAAWMAAIYPDHGWGGKEGQITDRLFRKKYEFARDEGHEVLYSTLAGIAARVKTRPGKGTPLIVFNSLSWPRTDPVTALVTPPTDEFRLVDAAGAEFLENDFYRIELAPGGVKRLYDKELGRDVLDAGKFLGFEVFTMQSVGNGAGEFGRVQQPTMEGFDKTSLHRPRWRLVDGESGPLRTVYLLEQPLRNRTVRERLIVYHGIKKIDCEVSLLGWDGEPYREFRLALPVAVNDYKDPTDAPVPYPMLQPILLASRRSCHGEGNWYLQEGDHHFRFSIVSHTAGWRNGYRAGIAAGSPLYVVGNPATGPGAFLPEAKSFLPFASPNIILSTMKKAENDDTVILRVYDIEGKDTEAEVELFHPVKRAERTNLIEEEGVELKPRKGRLVLPVGHHAVETLKLVPNWTKR